MRGWWNKWSNSQPNLQKHVLTQNGWRNSNMNIQWASLMGKLTVVALGPEDTVYRHAFVHEAADVVCATAYEAIKYLAKLSGNFHGD